MPDSAEPSRSDLLRARLEERSVRFGPYEADFRSGELRKHGRRIRIQAKPLAILAVLIRRPGEVVTRDELRRAIWAENVFVDFEKNLNTAVNKLRSALCDTAEAPRYVETLPKIGYRFVARVEVACDVRDAPAGRIPEFDASTVTVLPGPGPAEPATAAGAPAVAAFPRASRWITAAAVTLAITISAALLLAGLPALPGDGLPAARRGMVVLGDFQNATGDPVFDGTLRQALSTQMEESQVFSVLSDARIVQTLALMARPDDTSLTGEVSRTVCVRTGGVATIEGSIANLGGQYVLWLKGVDCESGEVIAREQATAGGKDKVLRALAGAAVSLRATMGESLANVPTSAAPPENVTTTSLEALQAYSLGYRMLVVANESAPAIPFFRRAISLDPNFAMAYARLGKCYDSVDQSEMAAANFRRAFELRERASERERFYIDAYYDYVVTGELEAARAHFEAWAQTFPSNAQPRASLGNIYADLGDYERSLRERETALVLDPAIGLNHGNLIWSQVSLGRFAEAKAQARAAQARRLDSPSVRLALVLMAWAEGDHATLQREGDGLMGRPGAEEAILTVRQMIALREGAFAEAHDLTRAAADAHLRHDEPEGSGRVQVALALAEALVGRARAAREAADRALAGSGGKDVRAGVAVVRALSGEPAQATRIAAELDEAFPVHTVVQRNYLPAIRAAVALQKRRPVEAIEALKAATPYERGRLGYFMLPVYLRGQAFLASGEGAAAAAEFRKILGYRGVGLDVVVALARLGLARALAADGDAPSALAAYEQFLSLWRDADPDLPVLRAAREEYAALRTQSSP